MKNFSGGVADVIEDLRAMSSNTGSDTSRNNTMIQKLLNCKKVSRILCMVKKNSQFASLEHQTVKVPQSEKTSAYFTKLPLLASSILIN